MNNAILKQCSNEKNAPRGAFLKAQKNLSLCSLLGGEEALLAEDRSATLLNGTGLERNLAGGSALAADRLVHLACGETILLALSPALLAPLWSGEVAGSVELLFTGGEREGAAAVAARQLLITGSSTGRS